MHKFPNFKFYNTSQPCVELSLYRIWPITIQKRHILLYLSITTSKNRANMPTEVSKIATE